MLAPLADEPERRGIPERRRPPVAEHHLVAVRQLEQLGQPGADARDERAHRRLPVAGAEDRRARRRERLDGACRHLGRAGAEPAVARAKLGGDAHAHCGILAPDPRIRPGVHLATQRFVAAAVASGRAPATLAATRRRVAGVTSTENAVQISVAEHPVWVEALAHGAEVVESWVTTA